MIHILSYKLPIFHVESVKIYTGQRKFTRAPPVAPVTIMRYDTTFSDGLTITKRVVSQTCVVKRASASVKTFDNEPRVEHRHFFSTQSEDDLVVQHEQ